MVVSDICAGRVPARSGGRLPEAAEPPGGQREGRRIRDDARDGVYVMVFSLLASTATTLALVLVARLAG